MLGVDDGSHPLRRSTRRTIARVAGWAEVASPAAQPHVGLMLMPVETMRHALLPLLEEELVEALSWSFEAGWGPAGLPPWAAGLLDHFAASGRLTAHGVLYSPLSVRADRRDDVWLARVRAECATRSYAHVSEHLGFMSAGEFLHGAPLPVPRGRAAIRTARTRLDRLAEATSLPVGLENLALAFSRDDARVHGEFVAELTEGTDRFVLLDLHNLYCQAVNFDIAPDALLASYPLERVRELHVSGGRIAHPACDPRPFRRDTHDAAVPPEVLDLVPLALAHCPNLQFVMLERLGGTIVTAADIATVQSDFRALVAAVATARPVPALPSIERAGPPLDDDDATLEAYESALLSTLDEEASPDDVRARLLADPRLSPYTAFLESAELRGLETAKELLARWGVRDDRG